jgi:hypothetical protein
MVCGVCTACGSVDDEGSSGSNKAGDKAASAASASEELKSQFSALKKMESAEGGTVNIRVKYTDSNNAEGYATLADIITASASADTSTEFVTGELDTSSESDSESDDTLPYNLDANLQVAWAGNVTDMQVSIGGEAVFELLYDGEDYYIDLSSIGNSLKTAGVLTEDELTAYGMSYSDVFGVLKVSGDEVNSYIKQTEESVSEEENTSIEDLTKSVRDVFSSDEFISVFDSLADKAEFDDSGNIVVSDISEDDLVNITTAVCDAVNSLGLSDDPIDPSDYITSDDSESSEEDGTISYSLVYDSGSLNQTHNITIVTADESKQVEFEIGVSDSAALASTELAGAKNFEDVFGLSFTDLIGSFMGGLTGTDSYTTDDYECGYDEDMFDTGTTDGSQVVYDDEVQ